MNQDILQRIRQIAADTFNEPPERVDPSSSPDTLEKWDSLTHLNFVFALEETFHCELDAEEIERVRLNIGEAVLVLETKGLNKK